MNTKRFKSIFDRVRVGVEVIYHSGLLARDRQLDSEVENIARTVWAAMESGLCDLFQRRDKWTGECDYIAVKIKPRGSVKWTKCYHKDWRKPLL